MATYEGISLHTPIIPRFHLAKIAPLPSLPQNQSNTTSPLRCYRPTLTIRDAVPTSPPSLPP